MGYQGLVLEFSNELYCDQDLNEDALLARLRRLAQHTKSGALQIPEEIHKAWKAASAPSDRGTRLQMAQMLAACDFRKDF